MSIDVLKIKNIYPNAVKNVLEVLNLELEKVNWSDLNKVHFLAQVAHESGGFRYLKENLKYSSKGLINVFPKYFKNTALNPERFAYKEDAIADVVYANRLGNGDVFSHDGSRYKGRGLIQITGKNNYTRCLEFLGKSDPEYLETVEGAIRSAMWFWVVNGLTNYYDLTKITKKVNGGVNGLNDRMNNFIMIKSLVLPKVS